MSKKIRAGVVAAALAAITVLPAAPAQASHSCSLEDPTLRWVCESHQDTLFTFVYCLISKSC